MTMACRERTESALRQQLHVVASLDGGVFRVNGLVHGVDGLHHGQPGPEDVVLAGPVEGEPELLQRQDRVEVAAVGEVIGDWAVPGDVDRPVQTGTV